LGSNLDFVAVTDAELDNDTYEGAENNFNKITPSKAIAGFNGYINQFPREFMLCRLVIWHNCIILKVLRVNLFLVMNNCAIQK
jgi:hypothetical protein